VSYHELSAGHELVGFLGGILRGFDFSVDSTDASRVDAGLVCLGEPALRTETTSDTAKSSGRLGTGYIDTCSIRPARDGFSAAGFESGWILTGIAESGFVSGGLLGRQAPRTNASTAVAIINGHVASEVSSNRIR